MKDSNFVASLWLKLAAVFDPVQHFFNGNFWEIASTKFQKYLTGSVLDLACGTGELADHISPQRYLGIDINPEYIRYAHKHRQRKNVHFIVGDISKIKLDEKFATAIIISATHHLSDEVFIKTCHAVKSHNITNFIVIDDLAYKPFDKILYFLDAKLGGGKYFRGIKEITAIVGKYFTIIDAGYLKVKNSFYYYPYVVARK